MKYVVYDNQVTGNPASTMIVWAMSNWTPLIYNYVIRKLTIFLPVLTQAHCTLVQHGYELLITMSRICFSVFASFLQLKVERCCKKFAEMSNETLQNSNNHVFNKTVIECNVSLLDHNYLSTLIIMS